MPLCFCLDKTFNIFLLIVANKCWIYWIWMPIVYFSYFRKLEKRRGKETLTTTPIRRVHHLAEFCCGYDDSEGCIIWRLCSVHLHKHMMYKLIRVVTFYGLIVALAPVALKQALSRYYALNIHLRLVGSFHFFSLLMMFRLCLKAFGIGLFFTFFSTYLWHLNYT